MWNWLMKLIAELKLWMDCEAPSPPASIAISSGESITMIKYKVTIPPGVQSDIVTTRVTTQTDGEDAKLQELTGNGGTFDLVVAEGSSGTALAQYIDKAGNESRKSPPARWENASDTTPPDAPEGAPQFSDGETVEENQPA